MFLSDQIKEIEKHKWIRSEEIGRDLGNDAILDWIFKYAKSYRDWWEQTHGEENGECCSGYAGRLSGCL